MPRPRLSAAYRTAAVLALLLAGTNAVPLRAATYSGADTMSFEMWCQEMQRYSADRCKSRSAADVQDYEQYRKTVEQYQQTRTQQQQRDQSIQNSLNRSPTDQKR